MSLTQLFSIDILQLCVSLRPISTTILIHTLLTCCLDQSNSPFVGFLIKSFHELQFAQSLAAQIISSVSYHTSCGASPLDFH